MKRRSQVHALSLRLHDAADIESARDCLGFELATVSPSLYPET